MALIEETKNIGNGMKAKTPSRVKASLMSRGAGKNMKNSTRIRGLIEILRGTILRSMRTRREPEAQAREGRDPAEMIETIKEESIAQIGGETPIEESIALREGSTFLREGVGGTIASR